MQKQAPTLGRILVMAIFTLSCFGLLLFLWSAFGGPVPLKPHGYRFNASFAEATQLAQEADVRISGVNVGKVKKIDLGDDGRTNATIELDDKYAPIPKDSRGDPAPEDAARRDLRRADAGHQDAPQDPRGRPPRDRPGRADRRAGRDLPGVRQEDARGLPDLAAGPRQGHRRATAPDFSDVPRRAAGVRAEHERGAEDPQLAGARDAARRSRTPAWCSTRSPSAADQLAHWIDELQPTCSRRPANRDARDPRDLFRAFPTFIDESNADPEGRSRPMRTTPTPLMRAAAPGRHPAQQPARERGQARRPTSTSSSSA